MSLVGRSHTKAERKAFRKRWKIDKDGIECEVDLSILTISFISEAKVRIIAFLKDSLLNYPTLPDLVTLDFRLWENSYTPFISTQNLTFSVEMRLTGCLKILYSSKAQIKE